MRAQANRVLVAFALIVGLPAIAVAEWLRRGSGRRVALRAVQSLSRWCGIDFVIVGADRLQPPCSYIFVANHSSPLDIPSMLVAWPATSFLAAADLFHVPLLGLAMRALGTIPIDRHNRANARQQLADLSGTEDTRCLTVFAEGAIAPRNQRLPFKSGAFRLAIATGASVVPVAIHGSDDVLAPHARLAVRPGTVTVEFLDPIATINLRPDEFGALRDRVRDRVTGALEAGLPDSTATRR